MYFRKHLKFDFQMLFFTHRIYNILNDFVPINQ